MGWIGSAIAAMTAPEAIAQPSRTWIEPCLTELDARYPGWNADDADDLSEPIRGDRLSQPVTRAEFAQMLDRIRRDGDPPAPNPQLDTRFSDVPRSHPQFEAIAALEADGFWQSVLDRVFHPGQHLARWELWVALTDGLDYRAAQPPRDTLNATYRDAILVPDEIAEPLAAATERKLVVNYPEVDWLHPYRLATRAEVAATLCQVLAVETGVASTIAPDYVAEAIVPEIRGVWLTNIDSEVLFSRQNLRDGIERLHRLNFNTIYPTVWNWGYTLYPSAVAEPAIGRSLDPEPGLQGRDMLQEAIEHARQRDMRVIPWFEFGFQAPSYSELARRNPDWLTQRADGTQTIMEGEHERVWLNPFHPEVQQFILDLVVEIVRNYDVDGIQFDDHLGLPVEFGYDPYTVALYRSEHDGADPPADYSDPEWVRWRANKITEFVDRAFHAIKAVNSDAVVSVSPNPQHFAYSRYLQDWERWERAGYIEELVLQVYRSDLDVFLAELDRPEVEAARRHIPVGIAILAGLKNRPTEMPLIAEKVRSVRERGFSGMSFFFYESLWEWANDPPTAREAGLAELFPEAVDAPDITETQD